jgi:hypothetical protein
MADKLLNNSSKCCGETTGTTTCCSSDAVLVDISGVNKVPKWVEDLIKTPAGTIPKVGTTLTWKDTAGSFKARWGIGRMNYIISPGLYAVGKPNDMSPVLVTANYKMTFDRLRKELTTLSAWIMVLDTKGINVWCAAGKGTFGTDEIINRIAKTKLAEVVSHRTLILPQLGAPGVAAHEVQKATGFKVVYGPVRASDILGFLKAGNKATQEMRKVRFGFVDRLILTPLELVGTYKYAGALFFLLFLVSFARMPSAPFPALLGTTIISFLPFLGAILVGAVFTPALLPYIPGKAFAWKGWLLCFIATLIYVISPIFSIGLKTGIFYLLALPAISSFLAMNFTGASTYTSLSGVTKEMKTALPSQIVLAGSSLIILGIATAWKYLY